MLVCCLEVGQAFLLGVGLVRSPRESRPGSRGIGYHGRIPATRLNRGLINMMAVAEVDVGSLVMFEKGNSDKPTLGLIVARDGKKNFFVEASTGRQSITPRSIRYVLPGHSHTVATRAVLDTTLPTGEGDQELISMTWELMAEDRGEGAMITTEEFAEMTAGGAMDARACAGAFSTLCGDLGKVYFKARSDGNFDLRTSGAVKQLLAKRAAEAEEERWRSNLALSIRRSLEPGGASKLFDLESLPEREKACLQSLKLMATKSVGKDPVMLEETEGAGLLTRLGRLSTRQNALKLCVQLGLFSRHKNLFLMGTSFERELQEDAAEQASKLLNAWRESGDHGVIDPDSNIRLDLTHLKTYTVDSADTVEVDDGLSIETLDNGRERIWVHIADVSRWLSADSPLSRDASRRQTTVYAPDRTVFMFPVELSAEVLSLGASQQQGGGDRCALSMGVLLSPTGEIEDVTMAATKIRVTYRLTYELVDEMLFDVAKEGGEEWELGRLAHWAGLRYQYRCANGSVDRFIKAPRGQVKVYPDPDGEDGIKVVSNLDDFDRPSTKLVTELMIMSGEGLARIAREQKIGVPFRCQKPPSQIPEDDYFESFPAKFCRASAAFKFMQGATVSSEPGAHWGLGIDGYVQWSSPIRRYNDLIVHWQIKNWLHGRPLLDGDEVAKLVQSQEGTVAAAGRIQRDSHRYWMIEFLRRCGPDQEHAAYVVGISDMSDKGGKVMYDILLTELGLSVRHPENSDVLGLGENLKVKFYQADPRERWLRLRWVRATEEEVNERIALHQSWGPGAC